MSEVNTKLVLQNSFVLQTNLVFEERQSVWHKIMSATEGQLMSALVLLIVHTSVFSCSYCPTACAVQVLILISLRKTLSASKRKFIVVVTLNFTTPTHLSSPRKSKNKLKFICSLLPRWFLFLLWLSHTITSPSNI